VYVHATGFCKELWEPVVREVERSCGIAAESAMLVDQRGHGDSTPSDGPFSWDLLARDLLEAVSDAPLPIVAVGHSSGGASILRAEILAPRTFSTIVLIEPIVIPTPPDGLHEQTVFALADRATRRRHTFSSRGGARQRFAAGPFGDWDEEILDLYVDHGLHEVDGGWVLKCDPSVEAEFYRESLNVDTWDRLGEIGCEVVIVCGEISDSHPEPVRTLLASRFKDATLVVLDGEGHLAPMECPSAVGVAIAAALADTSLDETGGQAAGTIG
jgi:pimeloyl-ACP methyl ester carboxylesterase